MKYTINNKTRINKYTVALATSTAMMASASAATIAWGEFDLDAAPGEISTNGTLLEALNITGGANTTTINGVTFTANNLFGGSDSNQDNGVRTGDANLDLLYLNASYEYGPITLRGLTIGDEYELQSFFGYNLNGSSFTMNVGDGDTIQKTASGDARNGTWITGAFTADATTQNFHFGPGSSKEIWLSGYQLRDISLVPEPSSAVLIGLGGLALILRRRR